MSNIIRWYHPCLLEGDNYNNHEAVRIDRALYRANVRLMRLEAQIRSEIRRIGLDVQNTLQDEANEYNRDDDE